MSPYLAYFHYFPIEQILHFVPGRAGQAGINTFSSVARDLYVPSNDELDGSNYDSFTTSALASTTFPESIFDPEFD